VRAWLLRVRRPGHEYHEREAEDQTRGERTGAVHGDILHGLASIC
jgi:hypothetical protein